MDAFSKHPPNPGDQARPTHRGWVPMIVAAGIFLFVFGVILHFATNVDVADVSLDVVGLILMVAGGLAIIVGLAQLAIWSRSGRRQEIDRTDDQSGPSP